MSHTTTLGSWGNVSGSTPKRKELVPSLASACSAFLAAPWQKQKSFAHHPLHIMRGVSPQLSRHTLPILGFTPVPPQAPPFPDEGNTKENVHRKEAELKACIHFRQCCSLSAKSFAYMHTLVTQRTVA